MSSILRFFLGSSSGDPAADSSGVRIRVAGDVDTSAANDVESGDQGSAPLLAPREQINSDGGGINNNHNHNTYKSQRLQQQQLEQQHGRGDGGGNDDDDNNRERVHNLLEDVDNRNSSNSSIYNPSFVTRTPDFVSMSDGAAAVVWQLKILLKKHLHEQQKLLQHRAFKLQQRDHNEQQRSQLQRRDEQQTSSQIHEKNKQDGLQGESMSGENNTKASERQSIAAGEETEQESNELRQKTKPPQQQQFQQQQQQLQQQREHVQLQQRQLQQQQQQLNIVEDQLRRLKYHSAACCVTDIVNIALPNGDACALQELQGQLLREVKKASKFRRSPWRATSFSMLLLLLTAGFGGLLIAARSSWPAAAAAVAAAGAAVATAAAAAATAAYFRTMRLRKRVKTCTAAAVLCLDASLPPLPPVAAVGFTGVATAPRTTTTATTEATASEIAGATEGSSETEATTTQDADIEAKRATTINDERATAETTSYSSSLISSSTATAVASAAPSTPQYRQQQQQSSQLLPSSSCPFSSTSLSSLKRMWSLSSECIYGDGWVIVTGGSSGVGEACCSLLAAKSKKIILLCRDEERGKTSIEKMQKIATTNARKNTTSSSNTATTVNNSSSSSDTSCDISSRSTRNDNGSGICSRNTRGIPAAAVAAAAAAAAAAEARAIAPSLVHAGASAVEAVGPGIIVLWKCDLADLFQVESFCEFAAAFSIDAVVANAGVAGSPPALIMGGIEEQIGVNFISHAVLLLRLLPHLQKQRHPSRIICITSTLGFKVTESENFDSFFNVDPTTYSPMDAYSKSKYAILLFARWFQRQIGISSNVVCVLASPGLVATNIFRHGLDRMGCLRSLAVAALRGILPNAHQGAKTILMLLEIDEADLVPGAFYAGETIMNTPPNTRNIDAAERLMTTAKSLVPLLRQATEEALPL